MHSLPPCKKCIAAACKNIIVEAHFSSFLAQYFLVGVGDKLIIAEQSLDQKEFIVVNTRTTSQGKIPTNFVKIGECVIYSSLCSACHLPPQGFNTGFFARKLGGLFCKIVVGTVLHL